MFYPRPHARQACDLNIEAHLISWARLDPSLRLH